MAVVESEGLSDLDRKDPSSSSPDSNDISESVGTSANTKEGESMEEEKEKEIEVENDDAPSQMMESAKEKEKTKAYDVSESTKAFISHFEKDLEKIFDKAADSRVSQKAVLYGIDAMMWTLEADTKQD